MTKEFEEMLMISSWEQFTISWGRAEIRLFDKSSSKIKINLQLHFMLKIHMLKLERGVYRNFSREGSSYLNFFFVKGPNFF